jgi:hypothetical protein
MQLVVALLFSVVVGIVISFIVFVRGTFGVASVNEGEADGACVACGSLTVCANQPCKPQVGHAALTC